MNKITTLFLVLCLICANTSLVIAEPVLPQFVIPQNETEVRSETSQSNDNIVVIAESDDLLQVIGYSYDMEGNLWWRVIDYRSSKDGYIIATSLALLAKVDMFKDQTFWEDTMNLIVYEFQGLDKSAGGFQRAQEIYYSMKEILIEKYGIPQTNELSYRIPVDNYLLSNAANSGTHIFSEWIVPYSDCYVIVSLICQSNGVCGTTYRLLSYEEYAAIANYYQNKADEIRSDL